MPYICHCGAVAERSCLFCGAIACGKHGHYVSAIDTSYWACVQCFATHPCFECGAPPTRRCGCGRAACDEHSYVRMGGASYLYGIQVTENSQIMELQCTHCIRFGESERIAREQALIAQSRERQARRPAYEARWNQMIGAVPTASDAEIVGYLQGAVIDVADYVFQVTRLGLRSFDGGKVFSWMDLPSTPISPGSLGDGFEAGQIVYGDSLEKLCGLVEDGRLPSSTAKEQVVRRLPSVPAGVAAEALRRVALTPVRHIIWSHHERFTTNTPNPFATTFEELKALRRSRRKERVTGWVFNGSSTGQALGQVSRRGVGLVLTADGRRAHLDRHSCRFAEKKAVGATGDALRESMEMGEVKILGDRWLILDTGLVDTDDLRLIRSHVLKER